MRLLEHEPGGQFSLVEFVNNIPPYAILSHTWHDEEVTFEDICNGIGKSKRGYGKLVFCRSRAEQDGLRYSWVDTCCIDKSSSAELSEAINSMFRWYQMAAKCYVYLSDVSVRNDLSLQQQTWREAFRRSRWFTRSWTLQELIAPKAVEFYSTEGYRLGDKNSLAQEIHAITQVPIPVLRGSPLSLFSIDERMSWVTGRQSRLEEDVVYSLLGIFDISMPLIYGEGHKRAFKVIMSPL